MSSWPELESSYDLRDYTKPDFLGRFAFDNTNNQWYPPRLLGKNICEVTLAVKNVVWNYVNREAVTSETIFVQYYDLPAK